MMLVPKAMTDIMRNKRIWRDRFEGEREIYSRWGERVEILNRPSKCVLE